MLLGKRENGKRETGNGKTTVEYLAIVRDSFDLKEDFLITKANFLSKMGLL